jgi:hypothetical protein
VNYKVVSQSLVILDFIKLDQARVIVPNVLVDTCVRLIMALSTLFPVMKVMNVLLALIIKRNVNQGGSQKMLPPRIVKSAMRDTIVHFMVLPMQLCENADQVLLVQKVLLITEPDVNLDSMSLIPNQLFVINVLKDSTVKTCQVVKQVI